MQFNNYLATFPAVDDLSALEVINSNGEIIHTIPAVEGKLGSLKLYNALAVKFNGKLNGESAKQGLVWFAEHLEDAKQHQGKHPNIDLLLKVIAENLQFELKPQKKSS